MPVVEPAAVVRMVLERDLNDEQARSEEHHGLQKPDEPLRSMKVQGQLPYPSLPSR